MQLFAKQGRFDDAQVHVERAKSRAAHSTYTLGRAANLQAWLWSEQGRVEEARSEALRAVDLYEKIGATGDLEICKGLIMDINARMNGLVASDASDVDGAGEPLGAALLPMATDSTFQARETRWYRRLARFLRM